MDMAISVAEALAAKAFNQREALDTADCFGCEFDELLRARFEFIESCRLRVALE